MKQDVISHIFPVLSSVLVIDPDHMYFQQKGIVERLGSASEWLTYYHVRLAGISTIITFTEKQLQNVIDDSK